MSMESGDTVDANKSRSPLRRWSILALMLAGLSWVLAGQDQDEACCSSFILDDPSVDHAIQIGIAPERMRFDPEAFQVRAQSRVKLIFMNNGDTRHNLLIVTPGETVADEIAHKALQAADSAKGEFVPEDERVLVHTAVLSPFEAQTLLFTAPQEPGDYPYLSTLPGRAATMRGILRVVAEDPTGAD